jgi:cell division topological specificity factor
MNFLQKLMGRPQPSSGQMAKERLKLVLVHDRVKMSPQMLQVLKDELIAVISRHLDVDQAGVQITIGEGNRLVADIPLKPQGSRPARQPAQK